MHVTWRHASDAVGASKSRDAGQDTAKRFVNNIVIANGTASSVSGSWPRSQERRDSVFPSPWLWLTDEAQLYSTSESKDQFFGLRHMMKVSDDPSHTAVRVRLTCACLVRWRGHHRCVVRRQIVDVKGLQYITNLLSSHSGLYLDVKQIEGKYKVRTPFPLSGRAWHWLL